MLQSGHAAHASVATLSPAVPVPPSAPVTTPRTRLRLDQVSRILRGRAPGQLIVQYTDKCNAACPQCDMRMSAAFQRSTLPFDTAKRSIDHAAANGVAALSITGGEPLLYLKDVSALLKHAHDSGILLTRTGTNGFLFVNSDKPDFEARVTRVAESLIAARVYTFWISIDSADAQVHETMRGLPGVIAGIRKALPIFHRLGLHPSVNLGINRNVAGAAAPRFENPDDTYAFFRAAFRRFYDTVINLGFTIANACYPMSTPAQDSTGLAAVYQATANAPIVDFAPAERAAMYRALHDTIPEYRGKIRIFSPRTSLLSLIRQHTGGENHAAPCRGGVDYFFVDAKRGHAFPCGYRGSEDLGPYWALDLNKKTEPATCRKCDWECWRDPSELTEPGLALTSRPWSLISRTVTDPIYARTWWEDVRYMRACNYYSARTKPDYAKLARFART